MIFSKNKKKKKLSDFIRSMDEKCGHSLPRCHFLITRDSRLDSFFLYLFIYFSLTMAGGEERNKSKRKSGEPKKKFIPPMFRD